MSSAPVPILSALVLIVGAGPTGLITALNLAQRGIQCILVAGNGIVQDWPKMDFIHHRSMELLKRMGLADELRRQGKISV